MEELLIETDVHGMPMLLIIEVRFVDYEYDTNWGGWWQVENFDVSMDGVAPIKLDAAESDRLAKFADGMVQDLSPPQPYYDD